MKLRFAAYLLLTVVFLPAGCISNHTERVADVNPFGWVPGDTVWVSYNNADTLSSRDISILLRMNTNTDIDTLRLSVCTVSPDSLFFCEALDYDITAAGKIKNGHIEYLLPYRRANTLLRSGDYRFGFVPDTEQRGITAIGIKLD